MVSPQRPYVHCLCIYTLLIYQYAIQLTNTPKSKSLVISKYNKQLMTYKVNFEYIFVAVVYDTTQFYFLCYNIILPLTCCYLSLKILIQKIIQIPSKFLQKYHMINF